MAASGFCRYDKQPVSFALQLVQTVLAQQTAGQICTCKMAQEKEICHMSVLICRTKFSPM